MRSGRVARVEFADVTTYIAARGYVCVCVRLFYDSGGWTRRFVDARPWQPSRESCHVESSPGDMTTAFYVQRVMSSSSLAAAVDPEIEIKYLSIATTSRSVIPYSAEQHSNGNF